MAKTVDTNHVDGVWKTLLKGSLLSVLLGFFLFCVVPNLAGWLLLSAGISRR